MSLKDKLEKIYVINGYYSDGKFIKTYPKRFDRILKLLEDEIEHEVLGMLHEMKIECDKTENESGRILIDKFTKKYVSLTRNSKGIKDRSRLSGRK
jgi:predicted DNA-binding protein (UPF0278 family)